MPGYSKMSKQERLRKRMFYQYNKDDFAGSARLGEALLRAHIRSCTTSSEAYEDDLFNTALASSKAGRVDRAVELYTESIHRTFNRTGPGLSVASRLTNLAALLSFHDQHESACRMFMQALTIRRQLLPYNHQNLGDSLYNMGTALTRAGRGRDALSALNGALHIYTKSVAASSSKPSAGNGNLVNCLHAIARAYEQIGEYDSAFPFAEAAWRGLAIIDIDEYHRAGYYLAGLYEAAGRHQDASELYLSTLDWVEQSAGDSNSSYINLAAKAANQLARLGEYQKSREILERLSKTLEGFAGRNNLTYSNCIRNLAIMYQQLGKRDEAEILLKESTEIRKRILGESDIKDSVESNQPEL